MIIQHATGSNSKIFVFSPHLVMVGHVAHGQA